jgi:hypothetical protein
MAPTVTTTMRSDGQIVPRFHQGLAQYLSAVGMFFWPDDGF